MASGPFVHRIILAALLIAVAVPAFGQQRVVEVLPDGTTRLGPRDVPLPATISPELRAQMSHLPDPVNGAIGLAGQREGMRNFARAQNPALEAQYHARVTPGMVGAVKINTVTPATIPAILRDRVLLHIHGGGFTVCDLDCSYKEALAISGLTHIKAVSLDYGLSPEHKFPSAVNEAIAVYRDLLKTHKPNHIAVFGSSAGAILSAELIARLKQLGLPLPGALGFLSGSTDFARAGDTQSLYGIRGFSIPRSDAVGEAGQVYLGESDPRDPVASPIYSDLHGWPPTLLMSSTRDLLLSGTANFERALHAAGVPTELVIYDGAIHTFWLYRNTPEAYQALDRQAEFLVRQLSR